MDIYQKGLIVFITVVLTIAVMDKDDWENPYVVAGLIGTVLFFLMIVVFIDWG